MPSIRLSYLLPVVFCLVNPILAQSAVTFDGAVSFETGGPKPDYVGVEDVNGDGYPDALVSTESKINFLVNDGQGVLDKQGSILLTGRGLGFAGGDFNGDGHLDIAVSLVSVYAYPAYQQTVIYLGDGANKPTFTQIGSLPVYGGQNIHTEDFNGDGWDDLLVGKTVMLSLGNGDFYQSEVISISDSSLAHQSGTFTADVNGDGLLDIVFAGVSSFCGNGLGAFASCSFFVPQVATVADMNDDGLLDIIRTEVVSYQQIPHTVTSGGGCGTVVAYNYSGRRSYSRGGRGRIRFTRCFRGWTTTRYTYEPETSRVVVNLQQSDGSYRSIAGTPVNGEIIGLDSLDLNDDGLIDIALTLKNEPKLGIMEGVGMGELTAMEMVAGVSPVLSFDDFDGNGYPDQFFVELSDPAKLDSDALLSIRYQLTGGAGSTASGAGAGTTTDAATPAPPTNSDFPAVDPSADPLELQGVITEVDANRFVVAGITIWFDNNATFKYEDGYSLDIGQPAQVEAYANVDGSGTAIKVQIGPY